MISFSVIVPIYNAEKYLGKCIDSILKQTYKEFELILVNDGSTDRSLEICKKYSESDSRVVLINKKNEGCIKARRTGIVNAKYKYVTFVDADDWINLDTLKIVNDEINNNSPDIIVFNMIKVIGSLAIIKNVNKSIYFNKSKIYEGDIIRKELAGAYLYGHPFPANLCGKVYKIEYLKESGKYLDKIRFFGEDLYYNIEIFLKAKKVSIIDEALYYYRTGGNTSRYMNYLFDDMISGYEIQKEVIEEFYNDSMEYQYKGISIMLLNTLKTCLSNIFFSDYHKNQINNEINRYLSNKNIIEASENKGAKEYFDSEFLEAIQNKNIGYLYELGKNNFDKAKSRKIIVKLLSYL